MYKVPNSVVAVVTHALEVLQGIDDKANIRGVEVAKVLVKGSIDNEQLTKIFKFFGRNTKLYNEAISHARTGYDSVVVLSYLLHGGDIAKPWANRKYQEAVKRGDIDDSGVTGLFSLEPEDIYVRFQLTAWRYAYGMDVASAAKFAIDYANSTGKKLDLEKAFGSDAEAVHNHIQKRTTLGMSAYDQVVEFKHHGKYADAVTEDLACMNDAMHNVDESLKIYLKKKPKQLDYLTTDIFWGTLIGYAILATEGRSFIKDLNKKFKVPASPTSQPKPLNVYHDAVNIYHLYFNRNGMRYREPSNAIKDKLQRVPEDMYLWLYTAKIGSKLNQGTLRRHFLKVYKWLKSNKQVRILFKTLLDAWRDSDYETILANIPLASDIYIPFKTFVTDAKGTDSNNTNIPTEQNPTEPGLPTNSVKEPVGITGKQVVSGYAPEVKDAINTLLKERGESVMQLKDTDLHADIARKYDYDLTTNTVVTDIGDAGTFKFVAAVKSRNHVWYITDAGTVLTQDEVMALFSLDAFKIAEIEDKASKEDTSQDAPKPDGFNVGTIIEVNGNGYIVLKKVADNSYQVVGLSLYGLEQKVISFSHEYLASGTVKGIANPQAYDVSQLNVKFDLLETLDATMLARAGAKGGVTVDGIKWHYTDRIYKSNDVDSDSVLALYYKSSFELGKNNVYRKYFFYTVSMDGSKQSEVAVETIKPSTAAKLTSSAVSALDTTTPIHIGTKEASDYMNEKGIGTVTDISKFTYSLGSSFVVENGKNLPAGKVIGYGTEDGKNVYVYELQNKDGSSSIHSGNMDYLHDITVQFYNSDNTKLVSSDPKKSDAIAKHDVDYPLSDRALQLADKYNITYVNDDSGFSVGSSVSYKSGSNTYAVLGVTLVSGLPKYIIDNDNGDDKLVSYADLSDVEINYEHETSMNTKTGEVVFGKGDDVDIYVASVNASIPGELSDDYLEDTPIVQPALPVMSEGSHRAAGVVAVFPPDSAMTNADDGLAFNTENPLMVLRHPLNNFGGKLTLPKGTVDPGESIELAAKREFYEETGMSVRLVAYLGDYTGATSSTRFFIGYVTGGDPKRAGNETDSVTLKPFGWDGDQPDKALIQHWAKDLSHAHAAAVMDAMDWMSTKGEWPNDVSVEVAEHSSMLPNGSSTTNTPPNAAVVTDPWLILPTLQGVMISVFEAQILKKKYNKLIGEGLYLEASEKPMLFPMGSYLQLYNNTDKKFEYLGDVVIRTTQEAVKTVLNSKGAVSSKHLFLVIREVADNSLSLFPYDPKNVTAYAEGKIKNHTYPVWFTTDNLQLFYDVVSESPPILTSVIKWLTLEEPANDWSTLTVADSIEAVALFNGTVSQLNAAALIAKLKKAYKPKLSNKVSSTNVAEKATFEVTPSHHTYNSKAVKDELYSVDVSTLKTVAGSVNGGSNPVGFLEDANGKVWFAKGSKYSGQEKLRAHADQAAANMMALVGSEVPSSRVVDLSNVTGVKSSLRSVVVLQATVDNAEPVSGDISLLSESDVASILKQHVIDMMFGDYDGHEGNWLRVGSKVIPIDRSQSFKFLVMGKTSEVSLNPYTTAPGNFGTPLANKILVAWSEDEDYAIPQATFNGMRQAITDIKKKLTPKVVEGMMKEYLDEVEAMGLPSDVTRESILMRIDNTRKSYISSWKYVLTQLSGKHGKSFKWGLIPGKVKIKAKKPDSKASIKLAKDMGYTEEIKQELAQAVEAGVTGKTIRVDTYAVENQEVMVHVTYANVELDSPMTLLSWKIGKSASIKAVGGLNESFDTSKGNNEPIPYKGDYYKQMLDDAITGAHEVYYQMLNANAHKYSAYSDAGKAWAAGYKDEDITLKIVRDAAEYYSPSLAGRLDAVAAEYPKMVDIGKGDDKNASKILVAVVKYYLPAFRFMTKYWMGVQKDNVASKYWKLKIADGVRKLDKFAYVTSEYPVDKNEKVKKYKYNVMAASKAKVPHLETHHDRSTNRVVLLRSLGAYTSNTLKLKSSAGSATTQYVVRDASAGIVLYYISPTDATGNPTGNKTLAGRCWATIPQLPSPVGIARAMKIFSDVTTLDMDAATSDDKAAMYWAKQAFATTKNSKGILQPGLAGSTVQPALEAYKQGDVKGAIKQYKNIVASNKGVNVDNLPEAFKDVPDAGGYRRTMEVGWTLDSVRHLMRGYAPGHRLYATSLDDFAAIIRSDALVARGVMPYHGVNTAGASVPSDMDSGGSSSIFGGILDIKNHYAKHGTLILDPGILGFTDVAIVGGSFAFGDAYGDVEGVRLASVDSIKANTSEAAVYGLSTSMDYQLNIRNTIGLNKYLMAMYVATDEQKSSVINTMIKFWGSDTKIGPYKAPPAEVVRSLESDTKFTEGAK